MSQKNLIVILLIGIGTGLLILVGILIFNIGRQDKPIETTPQPNREHINPIQRVTVNPNEKISQLNLISILPDTSEHNNFLPILNVEFTFNEIINKETLNISIEPLTDTNIFVEDKTLVVAPSQTWPPGKITISILPGTESIGGAVLAEPVSFSFISDYDIEGVEEEEYSPDF